MNERALARVRLTDRDLDDADRARRERQLAGPGRRRCGRDDLGHARANLIERDVELSEDALERLVRHGHPDHAQQPEEHVLGADVPVPHLPRLVLREREGALAPLVDAIELTCSVRRRGGIRMRLAERRDDLMPDFLERNAERLEHAGGDALSLPHDA